MQDETSADSSHSILQLLEPTSSRAATRARDALLALTDRRLIVAENDRLTLNIPYQRLRRVQSDIERARPATLVIAPDDIADAPAVLVIPPEEYRQRRRLSR